MRTTVRFDPKEMQDFDHGYAVTSHSSQGITAARVLVNMDTEVHPELISNRFAYVSVSRASDDAHIFTNDAANLAKKLSQDITKASAIDFARKPVQSIRAEQILGRAAGTGLGLSL